MNQILKERIYQMGTQKQINFMAHIGGMNEEEKQLFNRLHEGKPDSVIQDELNMSRKTYNRIEESVRAKLLLAVFECINHHMENSSF